MIPTFLPLRRKRSYLLHLGICNTFHIVTVTVIGIFPQIFLQNLLFLHHYNFYNFQDRRLAQLCTISLSSLTF